MALPARVQGAATNVAATAGTLTPSLSGVVAGNTLILSVVNTTVTTGYAASAVSGGGATWFVCASEPRAALGVVDIWVGTGATGGTASLTVTLNGATPTAGCQMDEWSGVAAVPFLESFAVGAATGTSPSAGAQVPTNVGAVLYVASLSANTQTASPAGLWSTLVGPTTAGVQKSGIAYQVAPSGASQTATWTQASGTYAVAAVVLRRADPPGYQIGNDPAAATNPAVLSAQATPDYADSLITAAGFQGTGVLSGCSVSPNTGADLSFQVGGGTALVNGAPVPITAATAVAITAADATNPRRDIVYVNYAGAISYTAGVASATPCPPTPPRMCPVLAFIDVPANATQCDATTSTAQAHVIDKRVLLMAPQLNPNEYYFKPAGVLFETIPASRAITSSNFSTGRLNLSAIFLPAGVTLGHITFIAAGTGAVTPTHWWFGLYDSNYNQLAVTADQTSTAWASSTTKTLAIATTAQGSQSTFTTTYTGMHFIGVMMTAATCISALSATSPGVAQNATFGPPWPIYGYADQGQTTPPAFPHVVTNPMVPAVQELYGQVSS